jgi:imidazolonepropionase-like amidohydrolase
MKNNIENNLVINNINILSMVDNKILKNKSIIIKDGLITTIAEGIDNTSSYCNVVDGQDKYIMPGLINMHTHLGDNKDDLLLYLANGVTTIRNMWGYEGFRFRHWLFGTRVFNHLELKKQIEEGSVVGPSIYTAGPILDGDPPFFPKFMYLHAIKEKKQIEQIIKEQVNKGYDFIKIYSTLSKQNFDDIIEIARYYDIPVAGHVPDLVGIQHVLESKVQSIEHLYGFINAYKPEQNVRQEDVKKLAALASANDVWNCPTLIANERLADIHRQQEFENEKQMEYISQKNKRGMRFLLKESNKLFVKKGVKGNHAYMEDLFYIIQQLKSEGAGILLGTDKAVPYVVAGFSEHAEMKLLSQAGLSNFEIMQAATINAAKCLKKGNEIGTIEKDKRADLIIMRDNPLHKLDTINNHLGVIKSGVFYSREKCDQILQGINKISL